MIYQEDYTIIVEADYTILMEKVNNFLSLGYVLCGVVTIVQGVGNTSFKTEDAYSSRVPAITQNFLQAVYKPIEKEERKEYV